MTFISYGPFKGLLIQEQLIRELLIKQTHIYASLTFAKIMKLNKKK